MIIHEAGKTKIASEEYACDCCDERWDRIKKDIPVFAILWWNMPPNEAYRPILELIQVDDPNAIGIGVHICYDCAKNFGWKGPEKGDGAEMDNAENVEDRGKLP